MNKGWIFGCLVFSLMWSGCLKDDCSRVTTYIKYEPVYMQPDEFRNGIQWGDARPLEHPGKIYVYEDYLLVNEMRRGIHVYDNSNPAAPQKIGFLTIPGNMDMAVRNGFLYADNATDLISIDLRSGIGQAEVVDREELAFQPYAEDPELGILIYHKTKEVTLELPCGESIDHHVNDFPWILTDAMFNGGIAAEASTSGSQSGGQTIGQGGSMARFSLMKDHLYVIDNTDMWTFETSGNGQLDYRSNIEVEWGIETLFGYGDYLFIGADDGMHIMDNTNPEAPAHLATYEHARACDPVFVSGDYAYVTLRNGTECQNFNNQLDVVSIEQIEEPTLVESFQMRNPHGLSVTDEKLYLCEGAFGLKSFDASIPGEVGNNLLQHLDGFHAYDIIVSSERNMIVTGQDGIRQFHHEPASGQFYEVSFIEVK